MSAYWASFDIVFHGRNRLQANTVIVSTMLQAAWVKVPYCRSLESCRGSQPGVLVKVCLFSVGWLRQITYKYWSLMRQTISAYIPSQAQTLFDVEYHAVYFFILGFTWSCVELQVAFYKNSLFVVRKQHILLFDNKCKIVTISPLHFHTL